MCQLAALHGVLERRGERRLAYHRVERHGAVFTRRNDIFFHSTCKGKDFMRETEIKD
jgi:hypothetical protein